MVYKAIDRLHLYASLTTGRASVGMARTLQRPSAPLVGAERLENAPQWVASKKTQQIVVVSTASQP